MESLLWRKCIEQLREELTSHQLNTWILPLHAVEDEFLLRLLAPNDFVRTWVSNHYKSRIQELVSAITNNEELCITLEVGSRNISGKSDEKEANFIRGSQNFPTISTEAKNNRHIGLRSEFTFENYVEGKSNQLARAASIQVALNPGLAYNPLFIYGGVGLGKTHLMHAVGNVIAARDKKATIIYLHSERFVQDMVSALRHNKINEFKEFYRSVGTLLIDDIQFFAGKERSQEEFFHTFNALFEDKHQIVLTCDRYPKEVEALEERLKSRFGWGLPVLIEPPELETRVAILKQKAILSGIDLPDEVAFFIAQRLRSNIRELEGALRRVIASAQLVNKPISVEQAKEALHDLLVLQNKLVTIENIQKTVAHYYKIKIPDLISKRRTRSVTRPRQIAMALSKDLTNHSLPEIGDAFGGRDHTTVIHACRKVVELKEREQIINDDYILLTRLLSS